MRGAAAHARPVGHIRFQEHHVRQTAHVHAALPRPHMDITSGQHYTTSLHIHMQTFINAQDADSNHIPERIPQRYTETAHMAAAHVRLVGHIHLSEQHVQRSVHARVVPLDQHFRIVMDPRRIVTLPIHTKTIKRVLRAVL